MSGNSGRVLVEFWLRSGRGRVVKATSRGHG